MNEDGIMTLAARTLEVAMLLGAPMLLSVLAVGVLVGLVQAATQINEMTLSFIPKLLVLAAVLMITGHWMLALLVDFSRELIASAPLMVI
ncbi:MAG: flagellar biosynthesis protein FliQ [Pseudomonadales bacterium]|nr:flagellar biosynthesis protein FliQ [Pseudomonadales bacterium]